MGKCLRFRNPWTLAGLVMAVAMGFPQDGRSAEDGSRSAIASPAGPSWLEMGPPVRASKSAFVDVDASRHGLNPSLVFTDALPSLGWIEFNSHGIPQIHFGIWNRSGWIKDSGAQNMDATHRAFDLAMSSNGKTPYLAWIELNGKDIPQLHVKHRLGDQWVVDGGSLNLDPSHRAANPALSATGPVPYVAWSEYNDKRIYQLYVKYLSENTWRMDGNESVNISPARDAIEPAIGFQGTVPYITWAESSDQNFFQVYVKRWNGSAWEVLGRSLNWDPENHALNPSIAFLGETPYVAWIEINGDGVSQLHVKRWENGSWVADGTSLNGDPTRHAMSPSLAAAGSTLYAAWTEYDAKGVTRIRVKHRAGDRWESDGPPFNGAMPSFSSASALAGSDSAVYLAWKEVLENGLAHIVVKKLQAP